MKIIRRGPKNEGKPFRWTCVRCKSRIEAEVSEGLRVSDYRDGDAIVFQCPVCKYERWVSKEKLK